jgi:pyruvate,orthophosphate dikinase
MSSNVVVSLDKASRLPAAVVGAKGHGLGQMMALGLPVPPGFVITTRCHADWLRNERRIPADVWQLISRQLVQLEHTTGRQFRELTTAPLLLAVRSGGAISMPGAMDTFLNVGFNPHLQESGETGAPGSRSSDDRWERFKRSYATISSLDHQRDLSKPLDQLDATVRAVLASSESPRVRAYQMRHGIPAGQPTAVIIQAMVFGNHDENSGSGVALSRDPVTGENIVTGDWLPYSQGSDVVSGLATPTSIAEMAQTLPGAHKKLIGALAALEAQFHDMVEVEFTVESGRLFLLQVRVGRATPLASARIAVELVREGLIEKTAAVDRLTPSQIMSISNEQHFRLGGIPMACGRPASSGIAKGTAATTVDVAMATLGKEMAVVLARPFTTPADLPVIVKSAAVITEQGGRTSHAALVCRELNIPCVVGCGMGALGNINGRVVTVDGTTGVIEDGDSTLIWSAPECDEYVEQLRGWATELDGGTLAAHYDSPSLTRTGEQTD